MCHTFRVILGPYVWKSYACTYGIGRSFWYHSSGSEYYSLTASFQLQPTKGACCSGVVGIKITQYQRAHCLLVHTLDHRECNVWRDLDYTDVTFSLNEPVQGGRTTGNSCAERSRVATQGDRLFQVDISRAGYSIRNPIVHRQQIMNTSPNRPRGPEQVLAASYWRHKQLREPRGANGHVGKSNKT